MSALTVVLFVAFVSLGRWQWGRYEAKQPVWDAFARGTDAAVPLGAESTARFARFTHVRVSGEWVPQRQFLLDNQSLDGRPGYAVLTPLRLADGRVLLVNRGWVPFGGFRDRLPDVSGVGPTPTTLTGRLDELPATGLARGRAAPSADARWPKVTSFPSPAELSAALQAGGLPQAERVLERRILLLDAADPAPAYLRRWKPPGVGPDTHWAYAIQWWGFAAVLLIFYVALNLRRAGTDGSEKRQ